MAWVDYQLLFAFSHANYDLWSKLAELIML